MLVCRPTAIGGDGGVVCYVDNVDCDVSCVKHVGGWFWVVVLLALRTR